MDLLGVRGNWKLGLNSDGMDGWWTRILQDIMIMKLIDMKLFSVVDR